MDQSFPLCSSCSAVDWEEIHDWQFKPAIQCPLKGSFKLKKLVSGGDLSKIQIILNVNKSIRSVIVQRNKNPQVGDKGDCRAGPWRVR